MEERTLKEILQNHAPKLPLPTKKSEPYRYFDIEKLLGRQCKWTKAQKTAPKQGKSLEITDGVLTRIPQNVEVTFSEERELFSEHFDPLYFVSHALSQEVITLEFKTDTVLNIEHKFEEKGALRAYRLVFKVAPNVSVKIIERFVECGSQESVVLQGFDLFVGRDARVEIIKEQTLGNDAYVPIHSNFIKVEKQASVKLFTFDFGDGSGLELVDAHIGEEAQVVAKHLLFAKSSAKRGTVSRLIHDAKGARSEQVAKNILQDGARGIFDALIEITHNGAGAKAHQNSSAVLLNDGAYMASKPQLVINIDDVEASHGSTIGELDEDQLFYLRSRGIVYEEAKKMLILAFANEIIDDVSDKAVVEAIHLAFERAYYGEGQLECIATCHNCEDMVLGER